MKQRSLRIPLWVWSFSFAAIGFLTWGLVLLVQISGNRQALVAGVDRMAALARIDEACRRLLMPVEIATNIYPPVTKWKTRRFGLRQAFDQDKAHSGPKLSGQFPGLTTAIDYLVDLPSPMEPSQLADDVARRQLILEAIDRAHAQIEVAREKIRGDNAAISAHIGHQCLSLIGLTLLMSGAIAVAARFAWHQVKRGHYLEERLRASEEKYSSVYTHGPIAYVRWELTGRVLDCNTRAEELFGWKRTEIKDRDLTEFVPEHARADTAKAIGTLIRDKIPLTRVAPVLTRGGRELLCEWHSSLLHDEQGRVGSVISSALDITERVRSEEQIRLSETRYRKLFESNLVGITLTSAQGAIFDANDAFLSMVGYSREDVRQGLANWARITPAEFLPRDDRAIEELFQTGSCTPYEKEYVHKNGTRIPVLIGSTDFDPITNKGQTHVCFVVDLTLRRAAEAKALATSKLIESIHRAQLDFISENKLSHVFDSLLDSLLRLTESDYGFIAELLHDSEGKPYLVAQSVLNIARNEDRRELHLANTGTGLELRDLDTLVGSVVTSHRPLISTDPATDPRPSGLPPGHPPIHAFLGLPFSRGETLLGVIGIANCLSGYSEADVAFLEPLLTTCASLVEAQRAEQRRSAAETDLQATKEAAVAANQAKDRFLAVLSHELRTPLTPVLAAVSSTRDDPSTSPEIRALCEMIGRNIELEARLIDDLLDVSKINRGMLRIEPDVIDAHELIHEVITICNEDINLAGLETEIELAAEAYHVEVDPARFQQVLWNLIKNSVKFTPVGGRITVRTENLSVDQCHGANCRLRIAVSDTGVGLESSDYERIFRDFERGESSQRSRAAGLGLGLSISLSVVESHGGKLYATSPGRDLGSTFTLEIATIPAPAVLEPPAPTLTNEISQQPKQLSIFFVEDNKDTLYYLSLLLSQAGHKIRSAGTLEEAIALADREPFDLLLSDIELPDGTGLELLRHLRDTRIEPILAIAMSGFGSDEDIKLSLDAGFAIHLTKPVDYRRLLDAIDRVVSREVILR